MDRTPRLDNRDLVRGCRIGCGIAGYGLITDDPQMTLFTEFLTE